MKIILFDGECSFCNKYIRNLLQLDKKEQLYFSSLQSDYTKRLAEIYHFDRDIDSIIYIKGSHIYYKSSAIIEMLSDLLPLGFVIKLSKIIPKFIRDKFYDSFAKHRKQIIQSNTCPIMPEKYRKRFL